MFQLETQSLGQIKIGIAKESEISLAYALP